MRTALLWCFAALSQHVPPPLLLLDFDVTGLTADLWSTTAERLRELAATCRARHGAYLFAPEVLLPSARAAGVHGMAIPPELDDAGEVALAVAGYVAGKQVQMTALVNEKAQSAPFRGAFDFRGGDATDDPLRRATVLTIALALEDACTVRRAA